MRPAIAFFLSLVCSCSSGEVITRTTGTADQPSPSGVYLQQAPCASIHVQGMDSKSWKHLSQLSFYTRPSKYGKHFRLPPVTFFNIVVENTSSEPIEVETIHLIFGKTLAEPIEDYRITETYKSPVYEYFDFHALFTYRKLLSPFRAVTEIDYEKDTEPHDAAVIPPATAVLKIVALPWVPVEYRTMILRFVLRCGGDKKTVDFNLSRFEYRPMDDHFKQKLEPSSK